MLITTLISFIFQKVKSPGRLKLESWLNAVMKIEIEDGRTLIGQFLCTDRDCNIILGSCYEYPPPDGKTSFDLNIMIVVTRNS
jgi:small nuclear ribonucleoprotein (snRNP)-like protein